MSSEFPDGNIMIGSGYIVYNPDSKKYYAVSTSHFLNGKNKKICYEKTKCISIKNDKSGPISIQDTNSDTIVFEVNAADVPLPFATIKEGTLQINGGIYIDDKETIGRFIYKDEKTKKVKSVKSFRIGDVVNVDMEEGKYVNPKNILPRSPSIGLGDWVASKPTPYTQKYHPWDISFYPLKKLDLSNIVPYRFLAVSKEVVLAAQIQPGQSGSFCAFPNKYDGKSYVLGHNNSANRFTNESTCTNPDKVLDLIYKLEKGERGIDSKLFGRKTVWEYDPLLKVNYRKLLCRKEDANCQEISEISYAKGVKIENGWGTGDNGGWGTGDNGGWGTGDNGINIKGSSTCPTPYLNLSQELEKLIRDLKGASRKIDFEFGLNVGSKAMPAIKIKKFGKDVFLAADWMALRLLDESGVKYEFVNKHADKHKHLKSRLGKNKCKTKTTCKRIRGEQVCSKLEYYPHGVSIYYGSTANNMKKLTLDKAGNPRASSRSEFIPYALRSSEGVEYFIDYTSLYYTDLMTVYADGSSDAIELAEKKYKSGPSVRISPKVKGQKSGYFPVEINFGNKSCK